MLRERCLCMYPDLALGLDPSRAHLERVTSVNSVSRVQCVSVAYSHGFFGSWYVPGMVLDGSGPI